MAVVSELRRVIDIRATSSGVKEATGNLQKLSLVYSDLKVQSEKTDKATLSVQKKFEALQRSIDPVVRATERMAAAERTLNSAMAAGLVTKARHAELMRMVATQNQLAAVSTNEAATAMGRLTAATRTFATTAAGSIGVGGGVFVTGILAAGFAIKSFISNTADAQKSLGQLRSVLESTHGAAGMTEQALVDLSSALQRNSTYSDGAVQASEALLLTFTQIGKDVFPMAMQAVVDMSTAMNSDLKGASIQLGKALNDPIKGISALSEVGVSFTNSQKEMIKSLVMSGNVAAAQTVILRELQTEFGGSAEAARGTMRGALASLTNAFTDLFEVSDEGSKEFIASMNALTDTLSDPATIQAVRDLGGVVLDVMSGAVEQVRIFIRDLKNLRAELDYLKDIVIPPILPLSTEQQIAGLSTKLKDVVKQSYDVLDVIMELRGFMADPVAMSAPGADAIPGQLADARAELKALQDEARLINNQIRFLQGNTQTWTGFIGQAAQRMAEVSEQAKEAAVSISLVASKVTDAEKNGVRQSNDIEWFEKQTAARKAAEDAAKKAADESARTAQQQVDALKRVNDQLAFDQAQLGRTSREQSIYNNLRAAGVTIDTEAGRAIAAATGHLYDLEQAQKKADEAAKESLKTQTDIAEARKSLVEDLSFDRATMFLNEDDLDIATRLRDIYGSDIPAALGSWEAQQIRVNQSLERAQILGDAIRSSLAGAIAGIFDGSINSLDDFIDKLTSGIANAAAEALGRKLTDKLFDGGNIDVGTMKVAGALTGAAAEVKSATPALSTAANSLSTAASSLERAAGSLGGVGGSLGAVGAGARSAGISGGAIPGGDVAAYIRQAATVRGIDPEIALRVAASEGGTDGQWRIGDAGKSFGPYQLYTGGGLGNTFQKQTGLALTPDTVRQQIDFALNNAASGGWGPWYGAAKVGVGNWDGLRGARSMDLTPASGPIMGGSGTFNNDRDKTIMAPGGWKVGAVTSGASTGAAPGTVPVSIVSANAPAFTGITKLVQSPMFQQAVAGFSIGVQSQSPATGAIGGALSGLMSAGPVGAVIGGLAGAIGGLFGKSQAAREELERAQEAWKAMSDEVRDFSEDLTGKVIGSLQESFRQANSQFRDIKKAAEEAGEGVGGLKRDLQEFKDEAIVDFNRGFGAVMRSLRSGLGDADPYLQSAQAIAGLREQLMGFIADTRRARGRAATDRARDAAQGFVLSQIEGAPEISEVRAEFRRIKGAGAEAVALLHDLGMGLTRAVEEVSDAMTAAIDKLRKDFEGDLQTRLNAATGKGVFNEFRDLIDGAVTDFKDAARIGADWTLVAKTFAAEAQVIVDNAQLTGSAFDQLIEQFPQLSGVVHEFAGTAEDAANRIEAINRTAQSIVDYVNGLRTGSQTTLSPTARLSAAQSAFNSQIALAQGGNIDAQASITKYADDLINASRAVYASTAAFQNIFTDVQNKLLALPAVQQTTDPVVAALRDVLLGVQGTTSAVNNSATTISSAVAAAGGNTAVAAALIPKFNALDTSVNGLLDLSEFTAGLAASPLAKNVTVGTLLTSSQLAAAGLASNTTVGTLLTANQLAQQGLLTSSKMQELGLATNATASSLLTASQLVNAGLATNSSIVAGFNNLDLNGDNTVSKLEALLVAQGLTKDEITKIKTGGASSTEIATALSTYFNTLDTSINGLLDANELKALGLASDVQVKNLIKQFDINGDNVISPLEALKAQVAGTTTAIDDQDKSITDTANALTSDAVDGVKKWARKGAAITDQLGAAIAPFYPSMKGILWEIAKATADGAKRPRPDMTANGKWNSTMATGGIVGNGMFNRDSVIARYAGGGDILLAGGEGVINASATSMIGPSVIDLINRTGRLPSVDDGRHWEVQNRVLATGFSAVVAELRVHGKMMADRLDKLERRQRIEASRD